MTFAEFNTIRMQLISDRLTRALKLRHRFIVLLLLLNDEWRKTCENIFFKFPLENEKHASFLRR